MMKLKESIMTTFGDMGPKGLTLNCHNPEMGPKNEMRPSKPHSICSFRVRVGFVQYVSSCLSITEILVSFVISSWSASI